MNCSAKPSIQEVCFKLSEALENLSKVEARVSGVDSKVTKVDASILEALSAQKEHVSQVTNVVSELEEARKAIKSLSHVVTDSLVSDQKTTKDISEMQDSIDEVRSLYENTIETVIEKLDVDGLIKVINSHTAHIEDLSFHMGPGRLPRDYSLNLVGRVADLEDNTTKTFFCTVLSALAAAVWAGAIGATMALSK